MPARPAAGGGQWVDVAPERLPRWLATFGQRHGELASHGELSGHGELVTDEPAGSKARGGRQPPAAIRLVAADGTTAVLFAPPGCPDVTDLDSLVRAAQQPRRLGLLLARRSAVAVAIAVGTDLVSSKVDTSYVQGRTAAGGWSQQRFARRRANQARAAAISAADIAVRLLLPETKVLDAVVTGGDRGAVDAVLTDPRLAPVVALVTQRFLDVGEPRLATLQQAVAKARAVLIRLHDPPTPER